MPQTPEVLEFPDLISVIAQFDARILEVAGVIESTHEIFEDLKKEWNLTTNHLRANLAKTASLRKKDFDHIIQRVFDFQDKRERGVRCELLHYLNSQKEFSKNIKDIISQVEGLKGSEGDGKKDKTQELRVSFLKLKENFEKREAEFKKSLENFKQEQKIIAKTMHELSSKGKILAKDFKEAIHGLLATLEKNSERKLEKQQEVLVTKAA